MVQHDRPHQQPRPARGARPLARCLLLLVVPPPPAARPPLAARPRRPRTVGVLRGTTTPPSGTGGGRSRGGGGGWLRPRWRAAALPAPPPAGGGARPPPRPRPAPTGGGSCGFLLVLLPWRRNRTSGIIMAGCAHEDTRTTARTSITARLKYPRRGRNSVIIIGPAPAYHCLE